MISWSTVNSSKKPLTSKTHSKKAQTAWTNHRMRLDEHPSWNGSTKTIISLELASTTARTWPAYRGPSHPVRN